jgi:VWFA-related protein
MSRSIAAFLLGTLLAGFPRPAAPDSLAFQNPPPEDVFGDEIDVTIHPLVVRVIDKVGNPILGLGPEDFAVRVRKADVPVASVDWVDSGETPEPAEPAGEIPAAVEIAAEETGPRGRTVVFFVQAGMHPSRIHGQLELRRQTMDLLERFPADDRIAVVSFDSHLKLRQDLTRDREAVFRALDRAILFDNELVIRTAGEPDSLSARFDFDDAWNAASAERALEVMANALKPFPGEKVVVYLGWGLGRFGGGGVQMIPAFYPAVRALRAARATVFVLDITDAQSHSLEVGLGAIAVATGGTYTKTYLYPHHATDYVARATSGYYVLTLDRAALPDGGGPVTIRLQERSKGIVHARPVVLR